MLNIDGEQIFRNVKLLTTTVAVVPLSPPGRGNDPSEKDIIRNAVFYLELWNVMAFFYISNNEIFHDIIILFFFYPIDTQITLKYSRLNVNQERIFGRCNASRGQILILIPTSSKMEYKGLNNR